MMTCKFNWESQTIAEKSSYIYQKATVTTIDGSNFSGWVYTVDPVTFR